MRKIPSASGFATAVVAAWVLLLHPWAGNATKHSTLTSGLVEPEWLTPAEQTDYRRTPSYEETVTFLRRLERASPSFRLLAYGKSGQGRDLHLGVVSKDQAFTPEAAQRAGKPVVMIQNGIHSGEIEGKDASLALLRDLLALGRHTELLDQVTLLVLPIFSVDAHERRSPTNRINQNGPEEMGWRTTPIGLNLNRDYLKAETPEMRAMLQQVFTRWWPHLLVDNHTTNGADYQYDLTYSYSHGAGILPSLDRWLADAFAARVLPALASRGHLVAPYVDFRTSNDPRSGIDFSNYPPRFSTGFAPLHCRPAILVETHMLKPYGVRVKATYDLLLALLGEVNARPVELLDAVAAAESLVITRGRVTRNQPQRVTLTTRTTDLGQPFPYKGFAARWEMSAIVGAPVPRYTKTPWDTVISIYRQVEPDLQVVQPAGYVVPQEWTVVRDLLDIHALRYRRLAAAWSDTVEVQNIRSWHAEAALREGHYPTVVAAVALEKRRRSFRPGDLWVPLDQRSALVALHLFEAQAPDGMMYWNFFDTVLERKEYAEIYVMEPLAREMLRADTSLAREFERRLDRDKDFASSPFARSEFFYRRSPWADPEQNLHPVVRAPRPPPEAVLAPD